MSNPVVLFFKSRVDPYVRGNRVVRGYTNRKIVNSRKDAGPSQLSLVFPKHGDHQTVPPLVPAPTKKFYVTMIRDPGPRQRVAWLAGPFDTHDEAVGKVEAARAKAQEIDAFSAFDAFGTASITSEDHKPGKLNVELGITAAAPDPSPAHVAVEVPAGPQTAVMSTSEAVAIPAGTDEFDAAVETVSEILAKEPKNRQAEKVLLLLLQRNDDEIRKRHGSAFMKREQARRQSRKS